MEERLIQFILEHEQDDVQALLLKYKEILGYPSGFVANQIIGRRKAKDKLPDWYNQPNITYPPQPNLEQSSSQVTAEYKAHLLKSANRNSIVDLTGGFGVDTYAFSKKFKAATYVEPDSSLCQIVEQNHKILGAENINHLNKTAEEFLKNSNQFDCIYIDPSRKANGKKVFLFKDCSPDVVELLPSIYEKTEIVLIKAAPLLDIKSGIAELQRIAEVHVVSVGNDCKEILFLLKKDFIGEPLISCVNLETDDDLFQFKIEDEVNTTSQFSGPLDFLYEPNASILKAGAFKIVGEQFNLNKLATNTHLYTSKTQVEDFPGRIFRVLDKFESAKNLSGSKANVITRNFPLSPDQLKKKYKIADGGEQYVLAFSGMLQKQIIIADRIK